MKKSSGRNWPYTKYPLMIIAEEVKVERLLSKFGAKAVVIRKDYTVFEITGHREETDSFIKVLEPYGLIEFVRSARVAIIKDSDGFHKKLKEFEYKEPGEEVVENEFLSENEESVFYVMISQDKSVKDSESQKEFPDN